MTITPQESRAARALLGWTLADLALKANVGVSTVADFETGKRTPMQNNLAAILETFTKAGIVFETGKFIGVKIKR
jgi:transcriptional regulator with XRE-family HTH domain